MIEFALFDGEGDEEAFAFAIEIGDRRDDARIGVAVLEVVTAQHFAVEIEAVWVVDVGGLEEAQKLVSVVVTALRSCESENALLPMKVIFRTFCFLAFLNDEGEVDALIVELNDLSVDLDRVVSGAAIYVENALDVGLHLGAREHRARFQLHFRASVVSLISLFPRKPPD